MNQLTKVQLGTLTKLDPRTAWVREDTNFSAWLAQESNLRLLSEAIDIELEFDSTEHRVGSFRADLRCRELGTDRIVIIENQLERTDHSHLGQLLTYAAGERLVSVIWIAPEFREEHRAALDWLNEVTSEAAEFIGIEIELWKIGDSLPAPRFNVVVRPNDWNRPASASTADGESTERQEDLLEFWTSFADLAKAKGVKVRPQKPRPQSWMIFALGMSDTFLEASVRLGKGSWKVAWVAMGANRERLREFMQASSADIEAEIGESLEWHVTRAGKSIQARVHRTSPSLNDPKAWSKVQEDMLAVLDRFHAAFASRIAEFKMSDPTTEVGSSTPTGG